MTSAKNAKTNIHPSNRTHPNEARKYCPPLISPFLGRRNLLTVLDVAILVAELVGFDVPDHVVSQDLRLGARSLYELSDEAHLKISHKNTNVGK